MPTKSSGSTNTSKYTMPKEEMENLTVEDYDQVELYEDKDPKGLGIPFPT